jgi:hypothetical protein
MPQDRSSLIETKCAICDTSGNSEVVYEANITLEEIEIATFSARRIPDRKTNQWVKCRTCGLFRSDPILKIDFSEIYHESKFEYSSSIPLLIDTRYVYVSTFSEINEMLLLLEADE